MLGHRLYILTSTASLVCAAAAAIGPTRVKSTVCATQVTTIIDDVFRKRVEKRRAGGERAIEGEKAWVRAHDIETTTVAQCGRRHTCSVPTGMNS